MVTVVMKVFFLSVQFCFWNIKVYTAPVALTSNKPVDFVQLDEYMFTSDTRRCGVRADYNEASRKRFVLRGTSWEKKEITWRIDKYTDDLPITKTRRIIKEAFDKWQKQTTLKFTEESRGDVDISIKFVQGFHLPCPEPFDGPGGSIAHAFYPLQSGDLQGDIHFDDAEQFTDDTGKYGISLPWVALHEIGHSLGLEHTSVYGAVMSPFYRSFFRPGMELSLAPDDIIGIQKLYGSKETGW